MKNLLNLTMLILITACATKSVVEKPVTPPLVEKPSLTKSLVNVTKYTNFTDEEKAKSFLYIEKMDEVVASKCFGDFMEARELIKTNGKTNQEVIKDLRTKKVDIELIMYYKRFSTVAGYTENGATWIKLNRKYHTGASICSEASNLKHELSHKLDYGHNYNATQTRPYSVPYSINEAFKACCK